VNDNDRFQEELTLSCFIGIDKFLLYLAGKNLKL